MNRTVTSIVRCVTFFALVVNIADNPFSIPANAVYGRWKPLSTARLLNDRPVDTGQQLLAHARLTLQGTDCRFNLFWQRPTTAPLAWSS